MSVPLTLLLAFLAAVAYLGATLVFKHWADLPMWLATGTAGLSLLMTCALHIEALRRARLADVVLMIVTFELAAVYVLSRYLMADDYALRGLFGLGAVLVGLGTLLWEERRVQGRPAVAHVTSQRGRA